MLNREQDAIDYLRSQRVYGSRDELPASMQEYWHDADDDFPLPTFDHPFLVCFAPLVFPADIETVLKDREAAAQAALDARNWGGYVMRHERAYRIPALFECFRRQPPLNRKENVAFWQLVAHVWRDAEIEEDRPEWSMMLNLPIPDRAAMTPTHCRRKLRSAPDTIRVFRGVQAEDPAQARAAALCGYQWTLDPDIAKWFARRFLSARKASKTAIRPWIIQTDVRKADIIAYMPERGEEEIVISPGNVMKGPTMRTYRVMLDDE